MKLDHLGFFIFLLSALIAPKVPFSLVGSNVRSSVSLGLVGLLLWLVLCPRHILGKRSWRYSFPLKGILLFGAYSLVISLASMDLVSMVYAGQYLFYLWFGVLIMSGYVRRAMELKQLQVTYKILAWVGLIYALGIIVSLWTGPFYPHQTMATARMWEGVFVQQGVGFSEGTNGAGAMLIVFCAFYWCIYRFYRPGAWLFGVVAILALLATISRSAIGSFCFGVIVCFVVGIIRANLRNKVSRRSLGFAVKMTMVLIIFVVGGYLILSNAESPRLILINVMGGFGVDDQSGIVQSEIESRTALWKGGIDAWTDGSPAERLFGRGFRGSLDPSNEAWVTPHNAYITMLGDFGLLGTLVFIVAIFGGIARMVYGGVFSVENNEERAALLMMAGLMMHNMTECFFYSPILMSMIILMLVFANVRHAEFQKKHHV